MVRAAPLLKNPDDIDAYLEAVNLWGQKIQMSSLNAYTSAWGEANPNGSKAQVAAYMQEAKFDVEESADLLKRILVMLGLPLTAGSASLCLSAITHARSESHNPTRVR